MLKSHSPQSPLTIPSVALLAEIPAPVALAHSLVALARQLKGYGPVSAHPGAGSPNYLLFTNVKMTRVFQMVNLVRS